MILETRGITKIYGGRDKENATHALNGIDLKVTKGEFVGVMGPSGSGKTSLLNIVSGIDKPTAGTVEIAGQEIASMSKDALAIFRRRSMGFVFQEFNLLDSLTLKENIMLPMILDKKKPEFMEERSSSIMNRLEIGHIGDKYPYNVSGGQQQRAAVARALVNDPAIVFADEPTGNLDFKSSKAVMHCFQKMNTELSSTILMVTHDAFAASHCKRIVFIKDGAVSMEILNQGDRSQFFDRILDCLAVLGGEHNDL